MGTGAPVTVPVPLSTFPGATPQESAGRLINCYSEPLGDPQQQGAGAPRDAVVWRRAPGLTQHAATAQSGYRGGLIANNLSYEAFSGEALTVDAGGAVVLLGTFPGTKKISIARNQAATPDVVAVDLDNGAYVLAAAAVTNATLGITFGGPNTASGNAYSVVFTNPFDTVNAMPVSFSHTSGGGETPSNLATVLAGQINTTFATGNITAVAVGPLVTITQPGAIGNQTNFNIVISPGSQTITFTGGGATFAGNANLTGGQGLTGAFSGTPTLYNGQGNLPQPNSVAFQDGYLFFTIGDGRVFATALNSLVLNALTFVYILSKADVQLLRAIAYQGYMFFFTTGSCEVWSDGANPAPAFPYNRSAVLTTGLIQANAIAGFETGFDDLLWVAQDYGVWRLPQNTLVPAKVSPPDLDRIIEIAVKRGDTLEASVHIFAGKKFWTIQSSHQQQEQVSYADFSWQFNLGTGKWNERASLQSSGAQGRWRGTGGHPAFSKWLMGDVQSGAVLFLDDTNFNDATVQAGVVTSYAPMLMRIETGVVDKFPTRSRVARADFHFVQGTGQASRAAPVVAVSGTASGTGGVVRLTVPSTLSFNTGDVVVVTGVGGTTEANGTWSIITVDATHISLVSSVFVHAFTSGGLVTNVTTPPSNVTNPMVAISWSNDGGVSWRGPSVRGIGPQSLIKTGRVSVKNTGLTGTQGRRWRMDISDAVYAAFLRATMSDDPTEPS
jgi:hypothetical protein